MAYTTQQAVVTLNGYLSIEESKKRYIEDTKNRGFVITLENGENIVISCHLIPFQHVDADGNSTAAAVEQRSARIHIHIEKYALTFFNHGTENRSPKLQDQKRHDAGQIASRQ